MKLEKIKPIPKYMVEKIRRYDKDHYPLQNGLTRYYAYLTKNDGELVKVTVAVKNRYKKWYCKPVVVHGVHSDFCYGQDMFFYYISGYVTKWYHEDFEQTQRSFDPANWGVSEDRLFDPFAQVLNKEYASKKFPEYRYSAVEMIYSNDVLKYLRYYEQYPQVEYLTKFGLGQLAFSKMILKQTSKDKKFAKWLFKNRLLIKNSCCYIPAIIEAYKKNLPLYEVNRLMVAKKALSSDTCLKPIREEFKGEIEKYLKYIGEQNISSYLYLDYLKACKELGIDMTVKKNRYPKDFMRWHDIRTDEYKTRKAELDEIKRKEFYEQFYNVAMKYIRLEYNKKSAYIAIIAQKPSDLMIEGDTLNHCVGKMNYDQKFVREDSLIFFIRELSAPDVPFVTVEYSPSQKKILQCYGYKDSRPSDEVLNFVNKKWLPYANRQIKKMAA